MVRVQSTAHTTANSRAPVALMMRRSTKMTRMKSRAEIEATRTGDTKRLEKIRAAKAHHETEVQARLHSRLNLR
jgi:hypothetical protein